MLILSMLLSDFASAGNASLPAPTVVAQMDSYIAMRLDEDCPLSFYLIFQEKQPFQGREIVRVFLDDDKNLDYRDYQMTKVSQLDNCNGVSLMGFIYPKKAGHYEISSIRVTFFDGSSETYPIGRLVVPSGFVRLHLREAGGECDVPSRGNGLAGGREAAAGGLYSIPFQRENGAMRGIFV